MNTVRTTVRFTGAFWICLAWMALMLGGGAGLFKFLTRPVKAAKTQAESTSVVAQAVAEVQIPQLNLTGSVITNDDGSVKVREARASVTMAPAFQESPTVVPAEDLLTPVQKLQMAQQ